jgi:hypothetical protein
LAEARRKKQQEAAKRRREAERKEREEAAAKEAAEEAEMAKSRDRLASLRASAGRKGQLKSVLQGYYGELDKLSKKAPADEVTELALKRINDLIKQCKELLQGDPFIDSIDQFVAAGERPEHRDALLVLRDLQQGIARFEEELQGLERRVDGINRSLQRLMNEI